MSKLLKRGHAVGDLRQAFCDWLEDNDAELMVHSEPVTIQWVIGQLWNCTDALPSEAKQDLEDMGIELQSTTYAAAARKVKENLLEGVK